MSYATRSMCVSFIRYAPIIVIRLASAIRGNGDITRAGYVSHSVHTLHLSLFTKEESCKEGVASMQAIGTKWCMPQDAENAISEYDLGQYDEDGSDLDTILDNGTLTGASSKYVKQAGPLRAGQSQWFRPTIALIPPVVSCNPSATPVQASRGVV